MSGKKVRSAFDKAADKVYTDAWTAADPLGKGTLDQANAVADKAEKIYRNRHLMTSKANADNVTKNRLDKTKEIAKSKYKKN